MGNSSPIGLFDSGVGGLTVAHALHTMLPSEQLIYFGDTAHLPYGDKSREAILQYSLGIADFLLEHKCKVILIACNSASANAFEEVKEHVGNKAVVMNVIDPVVSQVCADTEKSVGIIGTKATIDSGTYERKIKETLAGKRRNIQVSSLATPLFVPMIEEGFVFDDISNAIIRSYLSRGELQGIESLVLGCTHYPLLKDTIDSFMGEEVKLIDSAEETAEEVLKLIEGMKLRNHSTSKGHCKYFVTDAPERFIKLGKRFLGTELEDVKQVEVKFL